MTENEAKKWITTLKNCNNLFPEIQKACEVTEKLFEEIKQYRAIGTVEECRVAVEMMK